MAEQRGHRRVLQGVVISDKASKTVTVKVEHMYKHPMYLKYIRRSKTYMAHDEADQCHAGDLVSITECRPMSAHKRWRVTKVLKRAQI